MSETRERVETREDVLRVLRAHEAELRAMGIERLDLFGSFARDEAGPDSDVDLLVRMRAGVPPLARLDAEHRVGAVLSRPAQFTARLRAGPFRDSVCRDLRRVF